MVSGLRTTLYASLVTLSLLSVTVATANAQCVDNTVDAELTVRVDLTSRGDLSARSVSISVSGENESNTLFLESGEESTLVVSAGLYEYSATASGFETRSGTLSLCENSSLSLQLVPSRRVVFSGTVYSGTDERASGSKGATIVLTGRDERNGVVIREAVADDGTYTIEDVPAGFYAVGFALTRAVPEVGREESLGLQLPFVDVLESSQMDVRLVSNFDQADTELSLACAMSGGQFPTRGGLLLSLCTLGFVFWRRRVGS